MFKLGEEWQFHFPGDVIAGIIRESNNGDHVRIETATGKSVWINLRKCWMWYQIES